MGGSYDPINILSEVSNLFFNKKIAFETVINHSLIIYVFIFFRYKGKKCTVNNPNMYSCFLKDIYSIQ